MRTAHALFKNTEPKIKNDYSVILTGRSYVLLDVGTKYTEFLHGLLEKNEIGHYVYLVPCKEFFFFCLVSNIENKRLVLIKKKKRL